MKNINSFIQKEIITWEFINPIDGYFLSDTLKSITKHTDTSPIEVFYRFIQKKLYDKYKDRKCYDYHTHHYTDNFTLEFSPDIKKSEIVKLSKQALKHTIKFCKEKGLPVIKLNLQKCNCWDTDEEHQHCPNCKIVLHDYPCQSCKWEDERFPHGGE